MTLAFTRRGRSSAITVGQIQSWVLAPTLSDVSAGLLPQVTVSFSHC
jgi:hypothetical protein